MPDEETVVIYQEGMPEEGQAFSLEDVAVMLSDGRLSVHSLVKRDGMWKPFLDVFDVDAPSEQGADSSEPEIAVHFSELPPLEVPQRKASSPSWLDAFWGRFRKK